ncbi:MAG: hypothetical protein K6G61_05685 [Solobacterium sp.]|nr:hypothetical protein [Solobacterium sp.]
MKGPYDDIINMEHHTSSVHKRMSMTERAAQFSPFAALTGYGDQVKEAARLTQQRIILSEEQEEELDRAFREISARISEMPEVSVKWFEEDARKEGGAFRQKTGRICRADLYRRVLVFADGTETNMDDIAELTLTEG